MSKFRYSFQAEADLEEIGLYSMAKLTRKLRDGVQGLWGSHRGSLLTEPKSIVRYLTKLGEPIDVPTRSTSRGPPYWKSTVMRRKAGA